MLLLTKCPEQSMHGRPQKRVKIQTFFLSSPLFSLFLWFCLSWFEVTWVCNWAQELSSFCPLLLCVCQWAELPISSLPLGVWALEQRVASFLSSCVWLPLLWPPPSSRCLSLPPVPISSALSGYLEFLWGDWILSLLSPYLSAAVPLMSSLSVIGCLWKPLGFEELCAFTCACMCLHMHVCVCMCVCRGDLSHPISLPLLLPLPCFCLLPFSDQTPPVQQSRSKRRKETLSFISLFFL